MSMLEQALEVVYGNKPTTSNIYEEAVRIVTTAHKAGFRFSTKGRILSRPV